MKFLSWVIANRIKNRARVIIEDLGEKLAEEAMLADPSWDVWLDRRVAGKQHTSAAK